MAERPQTTSVATRNHLRTATRSRSRQALGMRAMLPASYPPSTNSLSRHLPSCDAPHPKEQAEGSASTLHRLRHAPVARAPQTLVFPCGNSSQLRTSKQVLEATSQEAAAFKARSVAAILRRPPRSCHRVKQQHRRIKMLPRSRRLDAGRALDQPPTTRLKYSRGLQARLSKAPPYAVL